MAHVSNFPEARTFGELTLESLSEAPLSLGLGDDDCFPLMRWDEPLPPLPMVEPTYQVRLIDVFCTRFLPHFDFLTSSRLRDLNRRHISLADSLGQDQTALIYACLCLAKFRELSSDSGEVALDAFGDVRQDIAWYRHAIKLLIDWGSASCAALREFPCQEPLVKGNRKRPELITSTQKLCLSYINLLSPMDPFR